MAKGNEKKLYEVSTGLGTFYTVATNYDDAAESVKKRLDKAEYGFYERRTVLNVRLMAVESFFNGKQMFTGFGDGICPLVIENS